MLIPLNSRAFAKSLNAHTFVFCANLRGITNNRGRKGNFR